MSDQPDLAYIQRRFDTLQKELREGLHTMQLRDDQRETSYQSLISTLTRQMVQVTTGVETCLAGFEQRIEALTASLTSFEHRLGMRMARTDDQVRSLEQRFEARMDRIEALLSKENGK